MFHFGLEQLQLVTTVSLAPSEKKRIAGIAPQFVCAGRVWHCQDVSWLLGRCHSSQATVLKNATFQLQASKSPLNSSGYFKLWHISPWNCADIVPLKSPEGGLCRAQSESGFAKLLGFSLLCRKNVCGTLSSSRWSRACVFRWWCLCTVCVYLHVSISIIHIENKCSLMKVWV